MREYSEANLISKRECWINVYCDGNRYVYGKPIYRKWFAEAVGDNFKYLIYRIHVRMK